MSIKLMSAVWENAHFCDHSLTLNQKRRANRATKKLVLLALADYANDEGENIYPSMRTLGRKSCISESQARVIVHDFVSDGVLEVISQGAGGAPGATTRYRLNVARLSTPIASTRGIASTTPSASERDPSCQQASTPLASTTLTIKEPSKNHQRASLRAPVSKLVDLYHEHLPGNPRCLVVSESRKKHFQARWSEWRERGEYETDFQGLAWWAKFFRFAGESEFLTGAAKPQAGRRPFIADIDFLIAPEANVKVFEGKYHEATA